MHRVLKNIRNLGTTKPSSFCGPQLKREQVTSDPIWPTAFHRLLYRRPISLSLAREIQLFINSQQHLQIFKTKLVLSKYISYCLHTWLLIDRLRNERSIKAFFLRQSLAALLSDFTKEFVYEFDSSYFDRRVFRELVRVQRTIFYSLDDWYLYGFRGKPFEQIVEEDLKLDGSEGNIEQYIKLKRHQLENTSLKRLVNYQICWAWSK